MMTMIIALIGELDLLVVTEAVRVAANLLLDARVTTTMTAKRMIDHTGIVTVTVTEIVDETGMMIKILAETETETMTDGPEMTDTAAHGIRRLIRLDMTGTEIGTATPGEAVGMTDLHDMNDYVAKLLYMMHCRTEPWLRQNRDTLDHTM